MKTANPFQIPTCFAELEQRRRARFKKTVVGSAAAFAALLVALLIQGCMTEKSGTAKADQKTPPPHLEANQNQSIASVAPQPATSQPSPVTAPPVVTPAPAKTLAPSVVNAPESYYVVKPGDSLSRIAKQHQTTVSALKAANNLTSDMIVIGAKLKLPTA